MQMATFADDRMSMSQPDNALLELITVPA